MLPHEPLARAARRLALAGLLALTGAPSARAVTFDLEALAGFSSVEVGGESFEGESFGLRARWGFGRVGVSTSLTRRQETGDGVILIPADPPPDLERVQLRSEAWSWEATAEVVLNPGGRAEAVLLGGAGLVAHKATDAEESELFERTTPTLVLGAAVHVPVGRRLYLRPGARVRIHSDEAVDRDFELSLAVGWRFGLGRFSGTSHRIE